MKLKLLFFNLMGFVAFNLNAQSTQDVTFKVNMNNYTGSFTKVYVSGTFNSWSGNSNELTDANTDGIYEGTFSITADSIEFKYTLDNWNAQEALTPGMVCTKTTSGYTNRFEKFSGSAVTLSTACFGECGNCQTLTNKNITFAVNMKQYTGSYTKVYVSGDFNSWSGNSNELTDADGDKIYTGTITTTKDSIEWKYTLDNWTGQESLTSGSSCTKTTGGYTNRFSVISGNKTFEAVCFNECSNCTNNVTFSVDMNKYKGASFTSVYVNGNFNGWCGSCNVMTDDNKDGVWEVTLPLPQDSIEFKYTLDGWNAQEALQEGTSCTKTTAGYTNRFTKITGPTTLSTVCWESCTSCASTKDKANVTFRVDVKKFGISYTNINLNGTFNNWCGACAVMTDDNKDSIYELTIPLFAGDTIEYKFTADGWSNDERFSGGESCTKTTGGFTNRYSVISGDSTLPVVCWAKCTACNVTSSTEEFNHNAVRLYPNPTTGMLNIQMNQASVEVLGVAVFDVQGKQVMNVSASNNVDLSKLVDGVYFVQIKSNVGSIYKEVILNR